MSAPRHYDQDKDSTLYIGNLDERTTDALIWELMLQAGPIINVHLPKDRVTQVHQGYGFVEFASEEDAEYASKIMNQIRLWGKPIRVNKASADKRSTGATATGANGQPLGGGSDSVGAELFVGNLDPLVDEKTLFDTFSRFGPLLSPPHIARDDTTNLSKGYGFVSYASFDASDDAIEHMHGQYLVNKEVSVQYAYKRDGKGERHGDAAERALAEQAKRNGVQLAVPAMPAALVGGSVPAAAPPMGLTNGGPVMPAGYGGGMGAYGGAPQYPPQGFPTAGAQAGYNYNAMPPPPSQAPVAYNPNAGFPPQQHQQPFYSQQQAYGQQQNAYPTPPSNGTPLGFPPAGAMSAYPPPQQYAPPSQFQQRPMGAPPEGAGLPARPPPASGAGRR